MKQINLSGRIFCAWTVVAFDRRTKHHYRWTCRCQCGATKSIRRSTLTSGETQSCGCQRAEKAFRHGLSQTRTYHTWASMKARCYNPRNRSEEHTSELQSQSNLVC